MKKEEKPQAQEIKIRYEPDRMIFEVEGKEFYLNAGSAAFIFGRNVEKKFEDLQGLGEDLGELNTLENFVRLQRLMKKGLVLAQIGQVMGYPWEKIREFNGLVTRKKNYFDPNDFEREMNRQADADYVKEKSVGHKKPGKKFIDLLVLRNDLRKGLTSKQIAELFEVDEKSFNEFLKKNQKYLDILM